MTIIHTQKKKNRPQNRLFLMSSHFTCQSWTIMRLAFKSYHCLKKTQWFSNNTKQNYFTINLFRFVLRSSRGRWRRRLKPPAINRFKKIIYFRTKIQIRNRFESVINYRNMVWKYVFDKHKRIYPTLKKKTLTKC